MSKLSSAQWLKAMRKHTADDHFDFNIPTMTGNAHQFEEAVSKEPYKYYDTVVVALSDPEIPMAYAYAGLKGLIAAKYDFDSIEQLYLQMIGLQPQYPK